MTDIVRANMPGLGKTYHGTRTPPTDYDTTGDTVSLEGTKITFRDYATSNTVGLPKSITSGRPLIARMVRNTSGGALLPGYAVTWEAGYEKRRVDGRATTTAVRIAGIVDPFLPAAGVRDDDMFWLVQGGPCLCKTSLAGDGENVISVGDVLYALTAATSGATTAGRVVAWAGTFSAAETTDGTAGLILLNQFGRALSAKTTANTNANILVDLELEKA